MPSTERLTDAEQQLWRDFLAFSEGVTAHVARDLTESTGLSVSDFEILVRLQESPEHALEQRALVDSLGWSPSRTSHQISRMQRRRLVERRGNGSGRAVTIALTEQGLGRVEHAAAVHAASVRRNFLSQFDHDLLQQVLSRAHELHEASFRRSS